MDDGDLSALSDGELLELWVQTEKEWPGVAHGGRKRRLARRSVRIVERLKARTGGTMRFLQPLLAHPDATLRLTAATWYKSVDHAAYRAVVSELAQRKDTVGRDAQASLEWDARWDVRKELVGAAHGVRNSRDPIDISKIFGWPDLIQRDLESLDGNDDGWNQLLQMGSYETGAESYGWGRVAISIS